MSANVFLNIKVKNTNVTDILRRPQHYKWKIFSNFVAFSENPFSSMDCRDAPEEEWFILLLNKQLKSYLKGFYSSLEAKISVFMLLLRGQSRSWKCGILTWTWHVMYSINTLNSLVLEDGQIWSRRKKLRQITQMSTCDANLFSQAKYD